MQVLDFLKGKIILIKKEAIVLKYQNIGIKIKTPIPINTKYLQKETTIYLYFKELINFDLLVYGFLDVKMRDLMANVLKIKGIGLKIGIDFISKINFELFIKNLKNINFQWFLNLNIFKLKSFKLVEFLNELNKFYFPCKKTFVDEQTTILKSLLKLGFKQNDILNSFQNQPYKSTDSKELYFKKIIYTLKNHSIIQK